MAGMFGEPVQCEPCEGTGKERGWRPTLCPDCDGLGVITPSRAAENATRIRTEDGVTVRKGDRVFNYYDRVYCVIAQDPDGEGWFDTTSDDGRRTLLNGERICSVAFAGRKGW